MKTIRSITLLLAALTAAGADGEPLTVAVASNFNGPAHAIAARYEQASGTPVRISTASTGKLYAQIVNGAPFDVLLAADRVRPELLESGSHGVAGTRFNYAIGALVLWSRDPALAGQDCESQLLELNAKRLAIANPLTAPYGAAAREYLLAANLWERVEPQLVFGENIAQTLHFVVSGNASLGLIARSQLAHEKLRDGTCNWPVPESMHQPLEQQAILLRRAAGNSAAVDFLGFLRGPIARQIIREHGYSLP